MMLFLVLSVLVAPPPCLCVIMAVNMTAYTERRKGTNHSLLTARTGIESSNSTCSRAQFIARQSRTGDLVFIKDKTSFDHPGYSLCVFDRTDDYERY